MSHHSTKGDQGILYTGAASPQPGSETGCTRLWTTGRGTKTPLQGLAGQGGHQAHVGQHLPGWKLLKAWQDPCPSRGQERCASCSLPSGQAGAAEKPKSLARPQELREGFPQKVTTACGVRGCAGIKCRQKADRRCLSAAEGHHVA